jgi:pimeloyl-ACP methyl ester carboxylesterase
MARSAASLVKAPSPWLALTELPRALAELSSLPFAAGVLNGAPRGDGHPVLVLPGFATGDKSTLILRNYLKKLGYAPYAWDLGRNFGPKAIGPEGEKLIARLEAIRDASGRKVSLIGWSLGGIMARLVANRAPEAVRQVITLGAPFAGSPKATNVWWAYEWLTGQKIDDSHTQGQLAEASAPAQVPSTAIFSRNDGVVAWQNCVQSGGSRSDAIEVNGSHCGLGVNPAVLYAVADRLAQPEGRWRPFEPRGGAGFSYPMGALA